MEPQVVDVQISIFVLDTNTPAGYSNVVTNLRQECDFLNGATETILPVPLDAPDDIPRVIVNTPNGRHEINIFRRKISLILRNDTQNRLDLSHLLAELNTQSIMLRRFVVNQGWPVNRIGVITNISYEVENQGSARAWLAEHYLHEQMYGTENPLEVYIRLAWQDNLDEMPSNYVVQMGHGAVNQPNSESLIIANFDVNTTPNLTTGFNIPDIKIGTYITEAIEKIKDLPGQYHLEEQDGNS